MNSRSSTVPLNLGNSNNSLSGKIFKKENIRVNCISPGGILSGQPENILKKYNNDCSSKGMLDAKDLVGVLTFLLSEDSLYINGQNIVIDDGWSL